MKIYKACHQVIHQHVKLSFFPLEIDQLFEFIIRRYIRPTMPERLILIARA
jgi:hypothetical protein